jgi:ring-1,2-phenylacetyl-CoA epoxidase subunit PaaC
MALSDAHLAVLALADDHLVLGQRVAELTGQGPTLEEELASANLGLDLIGQARGLYGYVAAAEGAGRTEDDLAFLRLEHEYRNLLLVEQPNEDFAHYVTKTLFFSAFMAPYWAAARRSAHAELAGIAGQAEKEAIHHRRHAAEWVVRLGDGTDESHARMLDALDALWPFCGELFHMDGPARAARDEGWLPDRSALEGPWRDAIAGVLARATLPVPEVPMYQSGGREGRHTEHMGHLLTELQYLQRAHPGASW